MGPAISCGNINIGAEVDERLCSVGNIAAAYVDGIAHRLKISKS